MTTVGMITIGQTPRDDLMPQFKELLGPEFTLLKRRMESPGCAGWA